MTSLRVLTWGCVILLAILSLLPDHRWYEPGFRHELGISPPTLGRLRSLWQGTARPEVACRSLVAFGCTPPSWNISSTSRPEGTQRSGILRRQHLERYAAVFC